MSRIQSVDVFKLVATTAVIAIHTSPFEMESPDGSNLYKYFFIAINQVSRFAVPFFFVISGFFWGARVRVDNEVFPLTKKLAEKIATIFLFWCVIYVLPYDIELDGKGLLASLKAVYWGTRWHIKQLISSPVILFMEGTKAHLWFLVGLLFSVGISAIFVYKKWLNSLIVVSIALYVIGVLAGAYSKSPIGIDIGFNTRNGPFFGTLLFVSGYFISGFKITTNWLIYGFLIFCLGCIAHFSELYVLWSKFATSPLQNYVFGTYFMGLGVAMMALSNHPVLKSHYLSKIGEMTLGIYAIHYLFVDLLSQVDRYVNSPFWEVGYVLIVLMLSVLSTWALTKFQFTKKYALGERRVGDRRKTVR